jgi:protein import protein ZIM17
MTFTCTAAVPLPSTNGEPTPTGPANQLDPSVPTAPCSHRSTHSFTRQAYTEGTVLIQCPECKNRHLIADHLGWFKELTEEGKGVDVERILRAKGEEVKRGRVGEGGEGTVEFY